MFMLARSKQTTQIRAVEQSDTVISQAGLHALLWHKVARLQSECVWRWNLDAVERAAAPESQHCTTGIWEPTDRSILHERLLRSTAWCHASYKVKYFSELTPGRSGRQAAQSAEGCVLCCALCAAWRPCEQGVQYVWYVQGVQSLQSVQIRARCAIRARSWEVLNSAQHLAHDEWRDGDTEDARRRGCDALGRPTRARCALSLMLPTARAPCTWWKAWWRYPGCTAARPRWTSPSTGSRASRPLASRGRGTAGSARRWWGRGCSRSWTPAAMRSCRDFGYVNADECLVGQAVCNANQRMCVSMTSAELSMQQHITSRGGILLLKCTSSRGAIPARSRACHALQPTTQLRCPSSCAAQERQRAQCSTKRAATERHRCLRPAGKDNQYRLCAPARWWTRGRSRASCSSRRAGCLKPHSGTWWSAWRGRPRARWWTASPARWWPRRGRGRTRVRAWMRPARGHERASERACAVERMCFLIVVQVEAKSGFTWLNEQRSSAPAAHNLTAPLLEGQCVQVGEKNIAKSGWRRSRTMVLTKIFAMRLPRPHFSKPFAKKKATTMSQMTCELLRCSDCNEWQAIVHALGAQRVLCTTAHHCSHLLLSAEKPMTNASRVWAPAHWRISAATFGVTWALLYAAIWPPYWAVAATQRGTEQVRSHLIAEGSERGQEGQRLGGHREGEHDKRPRTHWAPAPTPALRTLTSVELASFELC